MIFFGSKLPKGYTFEIQQAHEEINVKSFDNKNLNSLLFKAKKSKGLVFYLHGNDLAIDTWSIIASDYTSLGYDFFIFDYRGFGKSEGVIENQEQLYSDIDLMYKTVLKKYKEEDIVIVGYSIGTGLAAYLSSIHKPKMLILQAPYYNLLEFSKEKVPFIPNFIVKFTIETNKYIPKITAPIYIFHGDKDVLIPYSNSQRLSKLFKEKDQLILLKDQSHFGINENVDFLNRLSVILN